MRVFKRNCIERILFILVLPLDIFIVGYNVFYLFFYSLEIGISFVHIHYCIKSIFFIILGFILFKALVNLYNVSEKNNFLFDRAIRFYQHSEDWVHEVKLQSETKEGKFITIRGYLLNMSETGALIQLDEDIKIINPIFQSNRSAIPFKVVRKYKHKKFGEEKICLGIKFQSGRNKNKAIKNILESLISDYYYLNH